MLFNFSATASSIFSMCSKRHFFFKWSLNAPTYTVASENDFVWGVSGRTREVVKSLESSWQELNPIQTSVVGNKTLKKMFKLFYSCFCPAVGGVMVCLTLTSTNALKGTERFPPRSRKLWPLIAGHDGWDSQERPPAVIHLLCDILCPKAESFTWNGNHPTGQAVHRHNGTVVLPLPPLSKRQINNINSN
jgi:hypothetical protein